MCIQVSILDVILIFNPELMCIRLKVVTKNIMKIFDQSIWVIKNRIHLVSYSRSYEKNLYSVKATKKNLSYIKNH